MHPQSEALFGHTFVLIQVFPRLSSSWSQRKSQARTVVVMLHYYGRDVDAGMWRFMFEALAGAGHAYLAPSMPGHGRSWVRVTGGPARKGSIPTDAAWRAVLGSDRGPVRRMIDGGPNLGAEAARRFLAGRILRSRPFRNLL